MGKPMTLREALLSRLKSYEEEVRSGRHVPPSTISDSERPAQPPPRSPERPAAVPEQAPG
jgi:hypothetical protein